MILRCICGKTYNLKASLPLDGILSVPGNTSFLHFQNSFGKFVWLCPACSKKAASAPVVDEPQDDVAYLENLIRKVT